MTLTPIGHQPGSPAETQWHATLGAAFAAVEGKVCSTCGLGGVGHGAETEWLGYWWHPFAGIPATDEQLRRARALTSTAYRRRQAFLDRVRKPRRRVRCDGIVRPRHFQAYANVYEVEHLLIIERPVVSSISGVSVQWEWRPVARMAAS